MHPLLSYRIWLLLAVAILLTACQDAPESPAQRAATATLWQQCAVCHGVKEMQRGPILDGMPAWSVEIQLRKFAAGIRGKNPKNRGEYLMGQAVDKIPEEEDMVRLAHYIAQLPPKQHLRVVKGDLATGASLYRNRCASCHGDQAEGRKLLKAPPLAPLEDWYVADQLRKYESGRRGYHPDDLDGRAMAAAAQGLTGKEIRDLAAWIASQAK